MFYFNCIRICIDNAERIYNGEVALLNGLFVSAAIEHRFRSEFFSFMACTESEEVLNC